MRPATLVEVAERVVAGEPFDKALDEFLDEFYGSRTPDEAAARILAEPPVTGDPYTDAYLAATAEYLTIQYLRQIPPVWARPPHRVLKDPAFTVRDATPALREWFVFSSPAEFRNHNIFTEAIPLRRKRSARPVWLEG